MASRMVRTAIAQLLEEESGFLYAEREKKVVELSRKLLESVVQDHNVESFDSFCQELVSTIQIFFLTDTLSDCVHSGSRMLG